MDKPIQNFGTTDDLTSSTAILPVNDDFTDAPYDDDAGGDELLINTDSAKGDSVNSLTLNRALAQLNEQQRQAIFWSFAYTREKGWSREFFAKKLSRGKKGTQGYSAHTLYMVYRGKYAGDLDKVVASILEYKAIAEEQDKLGRPGFIDTALSQRIHQIVNAARNYRRMALVCGDGQVGKSESFLEYRRRHAVGTVRYLRLPSGVSRMTVLENLGLECGLNKIRNSARMQQQIIASFSAEKVLIVDELQQIALCLKERDRLLILELFREIFDVAGCAVVLCGTNEAMDEFRTGANQAWLRQLRRRCLDDEEIVIDSVPSEEDILAFAAHFGLPINVPTTEAQTIDRVAKHQGVGLLITYMQGAKHLANELGEPVTWGHFTRAINVLKQRRGNRAGGR